MQCNVTLRRSITPAQGLEQLQTRVAEVMAALPPPAALAEQLQELRDAQAAALEATRAAGVGGDVAAALEALTGTTCLPVSPVYVAYLCRNILHVLSAHTQRRTLTIARVEAPPSSDALVQVQQDVQALGSDMQALGSAVQALHEQLAGVQAIGTAMEALAADLQDVRRSMDALGTQGARGALDGERPSVDVPNAPAASKDEAYQAMQVQCRT